jgi:hypothetical protein
MLDIVGINSKKLEQLETDGVTYRLKGNEDTCQEAVEDFIEEKSFTQTMLEWLNLQSESIQPLGFAMCKNFNTSGIIHSLRVLNFSLFSFLIISNRTLVELEFWF